MGFAEAQSDQTGWSLEWIENIAALEKLAKELEREEIVSVDTETVGWETGNERLCLIQFGIPSRQTVAMVDVVSIPDIMVLEPALSGKSPSLVAHNAPFEERQFKRYGMKMRGVVDTLNMARKLRPDLPNHTLQTCCRFLLNLNISKQEQTSDWSARPLTQKQMRYAALDAEVTLQLYWVLNEMQEKLEIDANLRVADLMQLLAGTVKGRLELTQSIAAELALLNAREEMLRQTIRSKLIEGEPAYDGEYGKCKVTKIKKTEINPERVRRELPEIAELVIAEYVEKERLLAVMKEHGIDEQKLNDVTDVTGYTDRMNLTLKDVG